MPKKHPAKAHSPIKPILLLALTALLLAALLPFTLPQAVRAEYFPWAIRTFTYRDRVLPAQKGVPVSTLDPEYFSVLDNGWLSYRKNGVSAIPGIDVSTYQGEIDWQTVAQSGVKFAIIRAAYRGYGEDGLLKMDERFHQNIQGALDAGLQVGVYVFSQAITVDEALEEADLVLSAIDEYDVDYPVVFDWEQVPKSRAPRTQNITGEELSAMALAFCQRVEQAGYAPAVYFNLDLAYLYLDLTLLREYAFWLAEYNPLPSFYYRCDLWQYSHTGSVPGIKGNVDLNLAFRDLSSD